MTAGRAKQAMAPVVTIKAETTRPRAVPRGRREVKIKAEKKADLSRDPEPDTVVIRTNVAHPAATTPSMVARASFSKNMGMHSERVQAYTRLIVPSRDDRPWQPRSTDVRRRSPGASIPGGGYPPHQPLQDEYIVRSFDDVSDDDSIIMSPPPPTPPSVAVECSWPAAQTESRLETIDRGVEPRVARPPAAKDPIPLTPSPAASYPARQASTKIKTRAPRQLFSPVLKIEAGVSETATTKSVAAAEKKLGRSLSPRTAAATSLLQLYLPAQPPVVTVKSQNGMPDGWFKNTGVDTPGSVSALGLPHHLGAAFLPF